MDVQTQRALAHPKRTEILGYLKQKRGKEGADGSELADSLGLSKVQVKYHLAVLRDADLI
jgi:DNA-binding transcriptional ArsR family regulator